MLASALGLASRGFAVFPVHTVQDGVCSCGKLDCRNAGKHPRTANGFKDASLDPVQVERWWSQWPDANIGIATGAVSGCFVLDLDGPEAEEQVRLWEAEHGNLPITVTAKTGKGEHRYFEYPAHLEVGNRGKIGGKPIDVRGDSGYVVGPPSAHRSGNRYEWIISPEQTELAEAPAWLLDIIAHRAKAIPPASTTADAFDQLTADGILDLGTHPGVAEGGRHHTAVRLIGAHLGRGEDPVDVVALALDWAKRCTPEMEQDEVKRVVKDFAKKDAAKVLSTSKPVELEWPVMGEEAFYGLAGDIVRRIEPHTEADPNALLVQLLAYAGNEFGRGPHYRVESTPHHTNLFAVIVGDTAKARKGTGGDRVKSLFADNMKDRIVSGLSSGEGLIYRVRDERYEKKKIKKANGAIEENDILADPGIADKRIVVHKSEFGQTLVVMKREANTLSPIIRNAWDTGSLHVLTKNSPLKASGAHISIVGNITLEEVRKLLPDVEGANGFANRFLWILSKRSQPLPFGGEDFERRDLQSKMHGVMTFAKAVSAIRIDESARGYWSHIYIGELAESLPGLVGRITGRAEPQVLRMAMIYAILDCSSTIQEKHLRAALAIWRYALQSAKFIFGNSTGNPTADKILAKLKTGLTPKTQLYKLFGNHCSREAIDTALRLLRDQKQVSMEMVATAGRPSEVWRLT